MAVTSQNKNESNSETEEFMVGLDSMASQHVFCDAEPLLYGLHSVDHVSTMTGIGGSMKTNVMGYLSPSVSVYHLPGSPVNVLSMARLADAGAIVEYRPYPEDIFHVTIDGTSYTFKRESRGWQSLYVQSISSRRSYSTC